MTQLGMSALEVIRAGTLHAAQLLRLDESLGTIEQGKIADLVACDGDPVADIGLLGEPGNVVLVVQGGRIVKDRLPARPGP
jgi:imidazolonepropionase-like amidohydrolase